MSKRFMRLPDGRRVLNLVGKTYGKLTATRFIGVSDHGSCFMFRCECGREVPIRGTLVTTGQQRACGCQIGSQNTGRRTTKVAASRIGETHGRLTIVALQRMPRGGYWMVCQCVCGSTADRVVYSDLLSGKVVSCGCYQREVASHSGMMVGVLNGRRNYPWYFIKKSEKTDCRSGFEAIYAAHLIRTGVEFTYEPCWLQTADGLRYLPDFHLVGLNVYIEVKGRWTGQQREKIVNLREDHNIEVLYWDDIVKECGLPFTAYATLMRRAKRKGMSPPDYVANGCLWT